MTELHLIMPMGGAGSRFFSDGFVVPKPLIEIAGLPFFYWAARSIEKYVKVKDITFVVLKQHITENRINEKILDYFPEARIVALDHILNGAVLTCMQGVKDIPDELPVLFNDCDHMFHCQPFYDFISSGEINRADGGLLTFESDKPAFSYVMYNESGEVSGTVEKQVVSRDAICGAYYFKSRKVFENGVAGYLENCGYQEYFVSGVFNELAKQGGRILTFRTDYHVPFGTPEEYREAEKSKRFEELR